MELLLERRRMMFTRPIEQSPYDEFGYIKSGKVFHLDGIIKGDVNNAWTDIIGNITFPLVSGVEFETDCISLNSSSSIFSGSSSIAIPYQTSTLEIVVNNTQAVNSSYAVAFHGGTSNSLICAYNYNGIIKTSPNKTSVVTNVGGNRNVKSTISITNNYVYYNGVSATLGSSNNVNVGSSVATVGSRGGNSPSKFTGKIYAIRVYNRVLGEDEMLHNQRIDNERFNIGLDI